jgi:deazaflavin-dependent oxidoreductase (nitroreductase family)
VGSERDMTRRTIKYRLLRRLLWGGNRLLVWGLTHGVAPRAFAVLETTGRRSGLPRRVPVGNGLMGDTFWLVAAHGNQADYVRNIRVDPLVRVLVERQWRTGAAMVVADDDVNARSRTLPYPWDAAVGRTLATTPLTVRIALEPVRGGA